MMALLSLCASDYIHYWNVVFFESQWNIQSNSCWISKDIWKMPKENLFSEWIFNGIFQKGGFQFNMSFSQVYVHYGKSSWPLLIRKFGLLFSVRCHKIKYDSMDTNIGWNISICCCQIISGVFSGLQMNKMVESNC